MNNIKKVGILLAMLVLPAFIFFFLKSQGKNHFTKLPRYYPVIDEKTDIPVYHTVTVKGKQVQDTVFQQIPEFQLTDQNDKIFNSQQLNGKIHIAAFIFTRCPGQCPLISKEMQRIAEQLSDFKNIVLLSYTVDPEFDKPSVLKSYATKYNAVEGQWYFLTGDKKEIYNLAFNSYRVTAKQMEVNTTNLEDIFVHTEKLVLVDGAGIIRGYYSSKDKFEVDKLVLEAKVLNSELSQ
jgi:protein SCO1/2